MEKMTNAGALADRYRSSKKAAPSVLVMEWYQNMGQTPEALAPRLPFWRQFFEDDPTRGK
ncbi:MAG: hypothetical protein CM15mP120_23080 [Pseudomonadota bacterium]|nr:MAG: hypothetical protein CM15mP120_23080 [Pseudomonadota bacterium]